MEQNTIQIQHINLECPIAEFGFNRFLLTFFIRYRVLNSNAFRPGIGPQRYSLVFYHVGGSPNCWTSNCPACSKIEGGFKSQSIEIYWSEQRSALGCLSDQRLTEKQPQGNFHNIFIDIVSTCVSSSRWPPEPSNQHLLLCSPAPAKHVTLSPFSFCSLINWYQTLNCYVCVWGYFSHFTLVQNVLTMCTSLF